jgi:hypothetical protein
MAEFSLWLPEVFAALVLVIDLAGVSSSFSRQYARTSGDGRYIL